MKNTVEAYLKAGIAKDKIVIGMPTYGRSFSLAAPPIAPTNGYRQPFTTAGPAGAATGVPGVLAYYEILAKLASGELTAAWDDATLTPYAYSRPGNTWASYDDPKSLAYKVSYVIERGLGGAMIWSIDDDAFFAATAFPLVRAVKAILDNPATRPALPASAVDTKAQALANAIKNNQSLGNARTSALFVLFFVCGAANVDPATFVKNNMVTDGADANATGTFHLAAQTFALLNAVTTSNASDEALLNRFRNALNADLGNVTSNPHVAQEWDSYLFVDDAKLQGYYSVGFQLHFEQSGEQATKNLDNGVERTATVYHYIGHISRKPGPGIDEGGNTEDLWLEQPGDKPQAGLTLDGINYRLLNGADGKPVSMQQQVRDVGGLNEALAQAYQTAQKNYTPQYDDSGNLKEADPITRLAQYLAQTQFHPKETQAVQTGDPEGADRGQHPGHTPPKPITQTTGPSLTHDNPGKSDSEAVGDLLDLFGITSANFQDILNAVKSDNGSGTGGSPLEQLVPAVANEIINHFAPVAELIGNLVAYEVKKEFLDWEKQQTQKQGRATFYMDQQETANRLQLVTASVGSVFNMVLSMIAPEESIAKDIAGKESAAGKRLLGVFKAIEAAKAAGSVARNILS